MHGHRLFTSESVSGGHPDKLADQISDAVLDAALTAAGVSGDAADPGVRVACETLVRRDLAIIAGEYRLPQQAPMPDFEAKMREAVRDAGYCEGAVGSFDADTLEFQNYLAPQSKEIYDGTTEQEALGAGDQGMMFGYAVNETKELMPLPVYAAHEILRLQAKKRVGNALSWLRPDAKSQVTVEYEGRRPVCIRRAIFATHHSDEVELAEVQAEGKKLVREALDCLSIPLAQDLSIEVNTAGAFTHGGPDADCGVTGRKLMVDTYGAMARHGGGAFSGKDPTKVDRSAAYACRHVAKNLVAAGLAEECEVQVSYAIGQTDPGVSVHSFGTGTQEDAKLTEWVVQVFDLSPQGIIASLRLWQPFYRRYCVHGHFGQAGAPWEETDKVEELRALAGV